MDVGCTAQGFCRDTALCLTTRGQGTPDAMHRLSFCNDLRDTVRVKPSFPHDIA